MPDTPNITDEELAQLEKVESPDDWNAVCDAIKSKRDGSYPPDWWPKVKLSGLMDRVFDRLNMSTEIKVTPIRGLPLR